MTPREQLAELKVQISSLYSVPNNDGTIWAIQSLAAVCEAILDRLDACPYSPSDSTTEAAPMPLTLYSDEDIVAECRRRGCLVKPPHSKYEQTLSPDDINYASMAARRD